MDVAGQIALDVGLASAKALFSLREPKKKCLLTCIIYKYLQINTRHDVTRDFFKSPIETMLLGFAGEFELAQL